MATLHTSLRHGPHPLRLEPIARRPPAAIVRLGLCAAVPLSGLVRCVFLVKNGRLYSSRERNSCGPGRALRRSTLVFVRSSSSSSSQSTSQSPRGNSWKGFDPDDYEQTEETEDEARERNWKERGWALWEEWWSPESQFAVDSLKKGEEVSAVSWKNFQKLNPKWREEHRKKLIAEMERRKKELEKLEPKTIEGTLWDQPLVCSLIAPRDWPPPGWKVDAKELAYIREAHARGYAVSTKEDRAEADQEEIDEENYEYKFPRWKIFLKQYNEWVTANKDRLDQEAQEVDLEYYPGRRRLGEKAATLDDRPLEIKQLMLIAESKGEEFSHPPFQFERRVTELNNMHNQRGKEEAEAPLRDAAVEVIAQRTRHVVEEPGTAIRIPTCSGHQVCLKSSFPSSSLQICMGYNVRDSTKLRFGLRRSPPSSSFFTVLPDDCSSRSNRHSRILKPRSARNEDGAPFLDKQCLPSVTTGAEGKSGSVGNDTVEIFEDDDDETGDRVLEEQFNRFAMAMATQDSKLAQQIMQEMGDPESNRDLANDVLDLEGQLQELYGNVIKLIEEGDEDTARELIEANYVVVMEQRDSGYQSMDQIAMLDILAQLRLCMGEFEEAENLLKQAKDLIELVGIDSKQPLMDRVLEHMGSMYTALGIPGEALPFYLKSVEIQEHLLGEESPLIVKTLLGLATTLTDLDDTIRAIGVYKRVLLIIEKDRGPTDESLALPLSHLGHCLLEEGRVDEAELALLRALKLVEQTFGSSDGRVGIAKCALARAKAARGAVDNSVSLYREGMQIMELCTKFMEDDPSLETVRTDLAELLNILERHDEAEELWEKNLLAKERAAGPNDPALVGHLQNLATSYAVSGKYEKCVPLLRRSLKLTTANLGPNAPQVSVPLECLATALHHTGRQYEAEPLARQALHIREAAFGPDNAIVGEACNCLASILHSIGRFEEALTLMKRVLAIQEKQLGPDSPEIALTLQLMIMLLDKLGRVDEIEPFYVRLAMISAEHGGDEEDDMPKPDVSRRDLFGGMFKS